MAPPLRGASLAPTEVSVGTPPVHSNAIDDVMRPFQARASLPPCMHRPTPPAADSVVASLRRYRSVVAPVLGDALAQDENAEAGQAAVAAAVSDLEAAEVRVTAALTRGGRSQQRG